MKIGSLFSGIGGLDLGFERAGFKTCWQVEINEWCRLVLTKHWPDVPKYTDVCEVGAHNLEWVDVIVGGFPCQDTSLAGKRAGLDGARSGLWKEFARIVRELRPTYVVVENVPGILYPIKRDGRIVAPAPLSVVLGDLAACGYDAEWTMLSAEAVGAPHVRERVFIIAYSLNCRYGQLLQPELRAECQITPNTRGNGEIQSLAHPDCERCEEQCSTKPVGETLRPFERRRSKGCGPLAHTHGQRQQRSEEVRERLISLAGSSRDVADAECARLQGRTRAGVFGASELAPFRESAGRFWEVEPAVGGSLDGIPNWLDRHIGRGMSHAESKRAVETLRNLWSTDVAQAIQRAIRGLGRIQSAEVLLSFLREYQSDGWLSRPELAGTEAFEDELRGVRLRLFPGSSPQGQEQGEQRSDEHSDALPDMSREIASWDTWEGGIDRVADGIPSRVDRLRGLGNAVVPQDAEFVAIALKEHAQGIGYWRE